MLVPRRTSNSPIGVIDAFDRFDDPGIQVKLEEVVSAQAEPSLGEDHGVLSGLGDDDHAQYALLAGRSGGQTLQGGTASGEDLELESTSDSTKGDVVVKNHLKISTVSSLPSADIGRIVHLESDNRLYFAR